MSETKRRSKTERSENDGEAGKADGRRQTRVTLTKDVSSRYRKIMPETKAGGRGRKSGDGENAPTRGRKYGDGESAPVRGRKYGDGESAPARGRKYGDGESAPARGRKYGDGDKAPARGRKYGDGDKATSAGRKYGDSQRSAPAARRSPGGASGPASRSGRGGELAAIINRGLPEATRQVREVQTLLLASADEIINLGEGLCEHQRRIKSALAAFLADRPELGEVLEPILADFDQALNLAGSLFEKISFQDLAGQRLNKVEDFCRALDQVLPALAAPPPPKGKTPARAGSGDGRRRRETSFESGKDDQGRGGPKAQAGRSRLKGPQAAGDGLGQGEVDRLFGETDG